MEWAKKGTRKSLRWIVSASILQAGESVLLPPQAKGAAALSLLPLSGISVPRAAGQAVSL